MKKNYNDKVNALERVQYIHRVTGIKNATIREVLKANYLLDMNAIASGRTIHIGRYYTIYPDYRPAYRVYNPVHGKKEEVPAHYKLKIQPLLKMKEALEILTDNDTKEE